MGLRLSTSALSDGLLRFDNFELDLRAGELRKQGMRLRLQGQPLQVLAALLQRPGQLVTREELRAQIWPADTFVDFDHSLHNAMNRLREVLGDSAQKPRYVETLPRRGYRFIGQVESSSAPEDPQKSEDVLPVKKEVEPPVANRRDRVLAWGFACLILVAAGIALWRVQAVSHRASAGPAVRSIAVLPLENLSADASQGFLVDGMTDELITDLAKVSSLRVISRTSVMRYKGTKKSLPEIAKELNVDGIIEGSVMRSGQRVRITAQLLHGPTDRHLWADTFDRDLGDVLKLQSEVAEAIAQQVNAQLTPQQKARLHTARTVNPEAYEAYLRGRFYMTTEFSMAEQVRTAQRYFQEAIHKDPDFALAYSGLANSYTYLGLFHQIPPDQAYSAAHAAIGKALQLDDSIGEVHDILAVLNWRYDWNWDAAEREFNQALLLAPSYSCAHEDHSQFLSLLGRRAHAIAELQKSIEMDPSTSSALTEAGAYFLLRDFPKLVEASRRGVAAHPKEWLEHYYLGIGYEGTGKRLEAISEYQMAIEMSEGDQDAIASLAHAYAEMGKRAEAEKILHDLQTKAKTAYVSPYAIATIYAGLGDKERALEYLEQAYRERALDISWSLKSDLRLDPLRSDSRFHDLLRRVGLAA